MKTRSKRDASLRRPKPRTSDVRTTSTPRPDLKPASRARLSTMSKNQMSEVRNQKSDSASASQTAFPHLRLAAAHLTSEPWS